MSRLHHQMAANQGKITATPGFLVLFRISRFMADHWGFPGGLATTEQLAKAQQQNLGIRHSVCNSMVICRHFVCESRQQNTNVLDELISTANKTPPLHTEQNDE